MPCDYSLGKIYTIRNKTDDKLIYVGSTVQPLAKRWGGHKSDSNQEKRKDRILYQTINNNWDDWFIELYENFPCKNKEELCKREGEITRQIATLNHKIAGRTDKEYYEDNKEVILAKAREYKRIYRANNRDEYLTERRKHYKEYYENLKKRCEKQGKITCECSSEYSPRCKAKHLKTKKHKEYLSTLQE